MNKLQRSGDPAETDRLEWSELSEEQQEAFYRHADRVLYGGAALVCAYLLLLAYVIAPFAQSRGWGNAWVLPTLSGSYLLGILALSRSAGGRTILNMIPMRIGFLFNVRGGPAGHIAFAVLAFAGALLHTWAFG